MWIDAQSWWSRRRSDGTLEPSSHLHLKAYIPLRETLSGRVDLPIHLEAFRMPTGTFLRQLAVEFGGSGFRPIVPREALDWELGKGEMESRDFEAMLDTTMGTDGPNVMKLSTALAHPDGLLMLRTRYPVSLKNGNPLGLADELNWFGVAGWMIDNYGNNHQYPTARIYRPMEDAIISSLQGMSLPNPWPLHVGSQSNFTPISRLRVCIDPKFHDVSADPEGDPGRVLYDGPDVLQFNAGRAATRKTLEIDTKTLAAGTHRLFVQAFENSFPTGASAGAVVVQFEARC